MNRLRPYLLNCFLLILPALFLNVAWAARLPPMWQAGSFWQSIPPAIAYGENATRVLVNILPVFMPLHVATTRQRAGLAIYILGLLAYSLAWLVLVYFPLSGWSTSLVGSTAAAWTSLGWLVGIGLIGDTIHFFTSYRRWMYILLSATFAALHTLHAVFVYLRAS